MNPRLLRHGRRAQLVVVHGMFGAPDDFLPLCERLVDVEVIGVDLPGHHDQDAVAFADAADQLRDVLDALPGAHLLGYSLGGRLALAAAVAGARPRTLTLVSSSAGLRDDDDRPARQRWDARWAERLRQEDARRVHTDWLAQPLFGTLSTTQKEDAVNRRVQQSSVQLADAMEQMGQGHMPSLWAALERVPTPTLLVSGARDDKYVHMHEHMAAAMPCAGRVVLAGLGHAVHVEDPDALAAALLPHLLSAMEPS